MPLSLLGRTNMTIGCRDTDNIPKVVDAGLIMHNENGDLVQKMHNGLSVVAGGYHGEWMSQIIRGLRGHHEPQEELVYFDCLRYARHNTVIVELGAFWSYYSLWYLNEIPGSRAIGVEPDPNNLNIGQRNAALNDLEDRCVYLQAWVGGSETTNATLVCESDNVARTLRSVDFDAVVRMAEGQQIEMLHIDAQGAETPFLRSIEAGIAQRSVRFLCVSTHHSSISGSHTTHVDCLQAIRNAGGCVLVEHNVEESFSGDGLILASFQPEDRGLNISSISRNNPEKSLFSDLWNN